MFCVLFHFSWTRTSRQSTRMQAESSWHWRIQVLSHLISFPQLWHRGLKNTLKSWSKECQVTFGHFCNSHVLIALFSITLLFLCCCAVLKSSHGSANLSVLGNRSVKNESSPSVERQVCSAALYWCYSVYVHTYVQFEYSKWIFSDYSKEAEHRGSGRRNTEETSGQSKSSYFDSHSQWAVREQVGWIILHFLLTLVYWVTKFNLFVALMQTQHLYFTWLWHCYHHQPYVWHMAYANFTSGNSKRDK